MTNPVFMCLHPGPKVSGKPRGWYRGNGSSRSIRGAEVDRLNGSCNRRESVILQLVSHFFCTVAFRKRCFKAVFRRCGRTGTGTRSHGVFRENVFF